MKTFVWGICLLLPLLAQGPPPPPPGPGQPIKANFNNVIKLNAYADNWCMIYINGKLAAVDQIEFLPHNVVSVKVLPTYPMTIAVLAKDNADPNTGLEYGTNIGDAGFILKLSDGTVTNSNWKAKNFFKGPLNGDTKNPKVLHIPIPANWFAPDFDDSSWPAATEFTEARVKPDGDYPSYDFTGAKFIWSEDLDLDNTVIFRYTAPKPANFTKTWNADGDIDITNIVSEANLPTLTTPNLFSVNRNGLATGYLTRVRGSLQLIEQFAQTTAGVTTALPIDLGPATDQVFLILYGSNLGLVSSSKANIGGVPIDLLYAGPSTPATGPSTSANGVAQFNLPVPRSLIGAGNVDISVTVNGKESNAVSVNIK